MASYTGPITIEGEGCTATGTGTVTTREIGYRQDWTAVIRPDEYQPEFQSQGSVTLTLGESGVRAGGVITEFSPWEWVVRAADGERLELPKP